MKGMATCKVCGRDFALMDEQSYIVRDNKSEKGLSQVISGQDEPKIYDAFDCPHCGCQYIAQERKRLLEISCCDNEEEHEEEYVGDCEFCKYCEIAPDEKPCNECNHYHGKHNNFEPREDA